AAGRRATELVAHGDEYTPIGRVVDEKAIVNAVVALLATGGSTNHTLHLIAVAAAAGIELTWDAFADLATVTPLLTRMYPGGGRHGRAHRRAARRRAAAPGRAHRGRAGPGPLPVRARAEGRRADLGGARRGQRRPRRAAAGRRPVRPRRGHPHAHGQPGPR